MVLITLIGESQASVGKRFYFLGPLTECKDCRLKGVCFNLEPGHLYEVTAVRDTGHDCELHESKVRVVEVEKRPIPAAIERKKAIEGSMITFKTIQCDNIGCDNIRYCRPAGLKDGMKLPISEMIGDMDCPIGENLALVKLN